MKWALADRGAIHEIRRIDDANSMNGGRQMSSSAPNVVTGLTSMPLAFTENQGQWPDSILFRANSGGATMWFTQDGAYYQFTRRINSHSREGGKPGRDVETAGVSTYEAVHEPDSIETMMIKANFVGSNPQATVHGEGLMEYKCNYFLGNDPAKWRTDVPNYSAIVYKDLYPGIDVRYSSNGGGQVNYEYIAQPGTDLSQIQVSYKGDVDVTIDNDGMTTVTTKWGNTIVLAGQPDLTSGTVSSERYAIGEDDIGNGSASQRAEKGQTLAITLSYSTFLGGSDGDVGYGVAVDASGCAYVTGYTYSSDFPTQNAYDASYNGYWDVFVTKLSAYAYCCNHDGIRGDVDMSGTINVADVTYLTAYLKQSPPGSPAPPCFEEGDVDGSGTVNIADVTYLSAYLKQKPPGSPAPPCFEEGDVNGSGTINVADVTYLTAYLKQKPPGSPAPPACP
jgi:hypothetical protein